MLIASISNGDPVAAIAVWTLVAIGAVTSISYFLQAWWEFKKWRDERRERKS